MASPASGGAPGRAGNSSAVMRWTERVSAAALWAIAATIGSSYAVIAFLAVTNWEHGPLALQVVHLMTIPVGFCVLLWGFWGAAASAGGASLTALVVTVVAGRMSLVANKPLDRGPFVMEGMLFAVLAWLCLQFLEREEVEEIADRRQLERLEEEYLEAAIQYGKREDLLKMLAKKADRLRVVEDLGARLRSATSGPTQAIQVSLEEIVKGIGKGEAELILYADAGVVRFQKEGPSVEVPEGRDEIDRWLDEHRTALLVNNLVHDVRFTQGFGRARQIMSLVAVPLSWEGKLRGTLRLASITPQAFTHEDLRFASEAAGVLLPRLFAP